MRQFGGFGPGRRLWMSGQKAHPMQYLPNAKEPGPKGGPGSGADGKTWKGSAYRMVGESRMPNVNSSGSRAS